MKSLIKKERKKDQPLSTQVHTLTPVCACSHTEKHIYTLTVSQRHIHTASLTHTHTLLPTVPSKASSTGLSRSTPGPMGAAVGDGPRSHLNGHSCWEGLRAVTPLPCRLHHLILAFPCVQAPEEVSLPREGKKRREKLHQQSGGQHPVMSRTRVVSESLRQPPDPGTGSAGQGPSPAVAQAHPTSP